MPTRASWTRAFACTAALALVLLPLRSAGAVSRDVKSVLTAGEYGLLGGTALGLLSLPLARSPRGVFIGSSVGLYLGIAVGIYYISHRKDPGNPLRSASTPETESDPVLEARRSPWSARDAGFQTQFAVYRF